MEKGKKAYLRFLGILSTVGINIVASTVIGFFIGLGLDSLLGTKPLLMLVFLILGIIAGFINLFRMASRVTKEKDNDNGNG